MGRFIPVDNAEMKRPISFEFIRDCLKTKNSGII